MEENLLLEQYSWYKKKALEASPYHCLLDSNIQLNPHQINAYCAAVQSLHTGGIVLADEVGLGKTIEAGLSLKHAIADGARHILIALPATLRKQWEIELQEKFGLEAFILDRLIYVVCFDLTKEYTHSLEESTVFQNGNITDLLQQYVEPYTHLINGLDAMIQDSKSTHCLIANDIREDNDFSKSFSLLLLNTEKNKLYWFYFTT